MKKIISFSLLFFILLNVFAEKVELNKAAKVAINFLSERNKKPESLVLAFQQKSSQNKILYYVFNLPDSKGFIIISGEDRVYPILAYSFENSFYKNDIKPDAYNDWFHSIEKQIEFAQKKKFKADTKTLHAWSHYSNPDFKASKNTKDVNPLLTTTWNQGCGYNSLCPEDAGGPCGHVWAGCVATAMAQAMNYQEWPNSGEGSHSYTHSVYGEQSADFENTTYDWSNMPDGSGNAEISQLIYHCGVAVNMNYSPSGSGAYSSAAATAFKTYFKYTPNLVLTYKYAYTEENWVRLLRTEIDSGRPMYYQGSGSGGHAFNVDGYQGTDYFHFNWGWGGSYNGWFYLDDLTPGSMNFTNSQGAIVGMQSRDTYPGIDCSNPIILTNNIPYAGTTVGFANIANSYGGINYQETGKEVVHQITTSYPGRISASLTDLNGNNLDVFILSDCSQDSLIAYGDSVAVADNTIPGTYLIVVDGKYGSEGSYTLNVTTPDEKADLIITDQTVEPDFLQTGDLGYLSFTIKNIGNSNAGTSKAKMYYSSDNILDGGDIYLTVVNIPALNAKSQYQVTQSITIPPTSNEGINYIIIVADADNEVPETDELSNTESAGFNVPTAGIMDCSSSVSLSDNVWYYGNTSTDGQDNIDMYSWGIFPDKEVIHSISSTHSGLANVKFTEKVPGNLNVLILSTCNENACINSVGIWNPEDTITQTSFYMYAGITYYLVVDGEEGVSGNYGLKINTPGACPEPEIFYWGSPDLCTGQQIYLSVDWAYSDIQWYKDDIIIEDETTANLRVTEAGNYKARVTENGCSAFSNIVEVRINDAPANAHITAAGDTTFCEGNNVTLDLNTGNGYTVQWLKNGNPVDGETALNFTAEETGIYSAKVTNISCSINSNTKQITANPVTADIGEPARVNSNNLKSWFSCDIYDNTDLSGNGNDYSFMGWNFSEDRHGIWAHSQYFNGEWDNGTTTNSFTNPNTLTLSLWIKTNTNSGGMIIGLGDNQWGLSTICDRMIYMDDAGKLYFGVIDGTAKTVSSSSSYNDDNWHLINATLSADGMKLYVDGNIEAENTDVTSGADYTGWWKIAYDTINSGFPNIPTSKYYRGSIDDIKIYERELLADEISNLYEETNTFNAYTEQTEFCETGATNIILTNTENSIEYQLRNDADNSLTGSAVTGNANSINLPTGTLNETTTFNILATNTATGCTRELSNLFTINIHDLPTINLTGGATICEGETTDLTFHFTGSAPWNLNYTDGTGSYQITTSDNPYLFSVSDAGTYSVTALSDANCTGTDISGNAEVTVNDLPTVFLGEDTLITTNDTLILDAGEGFASYLWSNNSTEQTLTIYGSILGAGNYDFSVTVEDANTCENSDTINVTVENPLSVNLNGKNSVLIYPNPTNGIFYIKGINPDYVNSVSIITIEGKIIKELKPNSDNTEINLQYFPSGIYFVRIRNNKNELFYFKILKQ